MTGAGLTFHGVAGIDDARAMAEVFDTVWGGWAGASGIDDVTILALAHAGNYAELAVLRGEPVGAGLGFFGQPLGEVLHSHAVGVLPGVAGSGVGHAIKVRQREWCRRRSITTMTWTFDPLLARNAYLNIGKLGAKPTRYLINYYGQMSDGLNVGQASDRLLVTWDLTVDTPPTERDSPNDTFAVLAADASGSPVQHPPPAESVRLTIEIPGDIDRLRREHEPLSHAWRLALRESLSRLLDGGWTVTQFVRAGAYVLERS